MLPVVLIRLTVPALTAPLKLVPAELVMVKSPLPANELPEIVPAVPPFRFKLLPALVTAPIVIVLPAAETPPLVVSNEALPPKVTAPRLIAAALVFTVPLTVTRLGLLLLPVVDKPPVKFNVPPLPKVTEPVLTKFTAFVIEVVPPSNATLYALSVVVKLVADKLPLKAIVLLELVILTAPAATLPLKLVPAELAMVKLPLPVNEVPAIVPAVPPFRVKPLPALLTAPIVIVLPAVEAPPLVVSNEELSPKVTAPRLIAAALVFTVPFTVTRLGLLLLPVVVKPPVKFSVPPLPKVTEPVLTKFTASVTEVVLPSNATL